jgi:hypothetical protein
MVANWCDGSFYKWNIISSQSKINNLKPHIHITYRLYINNIALYNIRFDFQENCIHKCSQLQILRINYFCSCISMQGHPLNSSIIKSITASVEHNIYIVMCIPNSYTLTDVHHVWKPFEFIPDSTIIYTKRKLQSSRKNSTVCCVLYINNGIFFFSKFRKAFPFL